MQNYISQRPDQSANQPIIQIEGLSHDGRGIAHLNGKTIFIEGALPNEKVSFHYLKRRSNFDEAKLDTLIEASPLRAQPLCPHFGTCGGCSLQHLQNQIQLELKQKSAFEQFKHIGEINIAEQDILPPLTGPIWNYRYKARLSVKYVSKKNKVLVGFHEKSWRYIAETTKCPILHEAFSNKITELSLLIASLDNYQQIPQIEIACAAGSQQEQHNQLALVIRNLREFNEADLCKLKQFATANNYYLFLQPQGLDSVHCITHDIEFLHYTLQNQIRELQLYFKPTDFTQINYHVNQKMTEKIVELLDPHPEEKILDLFCGIGNFTLPLSLYCSSCVGVEGNNEAVKRATFNAAQNQIQNTSFYTADLNQEKWAQESIDTWAKEKYDKILLDPPRTGALECIKQLKQFNASKIVYVSCNPATLARDSKEIVQQGYKLKHVGIIDMFPHTSHVETVAVFVR